MLGVVFAICEKAPALAGDAWLCPAAPDATEAYDIRRGTFPAAGLDVCEPGRTPVGREPFVMIACNSSVLEPTPVTETVLCIMVRSSRTRGRSRLKSRGGRGWAVLGLYVRSADAVRSHLLVEGIVAWVNAYDR